MTVLLADEIKRRCDEEGMIEPFKSDQLRAASYQLTLGDEANVGGEYKQLTNSKPLVLEPHQVAVVKIGETLRIPRDLIARWSLRVTNIYDGLLWTGGPQVDPGWEGQLYCPVYNLAERTVVLRCGDPLFTIDFVNTTGTTDDLKGIKELKEDPDYKEVWFEPKRRSLQDHDRHQLKSAPYEALQDLSELSHFRRTAYVAASFMMLALTLMVGALTVIAGTTYVEITFPLAVWCLWVILGVMALFAFVSFVVSIFVLWKVRRLL